jgi:hypothetical protein
MTSNQTPSISRSIPDVFQLLLMRLQAIRDYYEKTHDLVQQDIVEVLISKMKMERDHHGILLNQFRAFPTSQLHPIDDCIKRLEDLCKEAEVIKYPKKMMQDILTKNLQTRRQECARMGIDLAADEAYQGMSENLRAVERS